MRLPKDIMDSQLVRGLMLYLVLPTLAFFLLGREFFISRPLINNDYLFLWICSSYLSRRATIGLYAGLAGLDLILSTESIYHFSTVDIILAARDFMEFESVVSCALAGALLLAAAAVLALIRSRSTAGPKLARRSQLVIGISALAVTGASLTRSYDLLDIYPKTFGDNTIAASGVAETLLAGFEFETASSEDQRTFPVKEAATSRVMRDMSAGGKSAVPYNIVVILVESQGLLKSENDMRRVLAPLIDPAIERRYVVNKGTARFHGATMAGELRALCRLYVPYAIPSNLKGLERCLPNLARDFGYETVSYHAFNRWFYERWNWYPALGFQRSYFAGELEPLSPLSCGTAFRGICDLWIAGQVEQELLASGGKRKFVYWLTLNSHLPVDSHLASDSSFDCRATATLREDIGPCELARIHFQLYTRIAQMLLNEKLAPTRFIIVGDHMPPFATLSERALYDNGRVPFVDLIPRGVARAQAPVSRVSGNRQCAPVPRAAISAARRARRPQRVRREPVAPRRGKGRCGKRARRPGRTRPLRA